MGCYIIMLELLQTTAYCTKRSDGNNFSISTCFAIFELIKFMCFGSAISYPHEEFLIPRPPRTCNKFNPHPPRTRTQSSVGSRTRPANAGTHNPRGLTRPAQDSSAYIKNNLKHLKRRDLQFKMYGCENIWLEILGKCQKVVIGVVYTWA